MTEQADHLAELCFTGGLYDSCALDDRASRRQLRARIPDTYDGIVDLIGRVHAADLRRHAFRIWLSQTEHIDTDLSAEQQRLLASTLHDREETLVRVRGRGRYRITGELIHAHNVEQLDFLDLDLFTLDPDAPSLPEMIEEAFADVPAETWAALPRDLAARHDDYFTGAATY